MAAAAGTGRSPATTVCDRCALEAAARPVDDAGPGLANRVDDCVSSLREPSGGTDPLLLPRVSKTGRSYSVLDGHEGAVECGAPSVSNLSEADHSRGRRLVEATRSSHSTLRKRGICLRTGSHNDATCRQAIDRRSRSSELLRSATRRNATTPDFRLSVRALDLPMTTAPCSS